MPEHDETMWKAFDFDLKIEGQNADKGFVVTIDGKPVLFMLASHEMRLTGGTYCRRIIEIDGVEHEIAVTIEGVAVE